MNMGRDLISKANGTGRGDMSATFGLDHARRLVRRADVRRPPVNPSELKAARQLLSKNRRRGGRLNDDR